MLKKQKLKWLSGVTFACFGCLWATPSQETIEASRLGATHIGTFEGSTTFTTSSENGIHPGLFIEVMDDEGNLTQYESEEGIITIPNTKEGAYVTQAKLLGKTKYRDQDTNELLDEWEDGRSLTLESVQSPVLTTTGKNLFDYEDFKNTVLNGGATTKYPISLEPNKTYTFSDRTGLWNGGNGYYVNLYLVDENNVNVAKLIDSNLGNRKSFTFTTSNSNEYYLFIHKNNMDNMAMASSDFQIEEGFTATAYEPYKANILTVNEDVVLHKVEDIQDTINLSNGEYVQCVEEVVLNGNEAWQLLDNTTENTIGFSLRKVLPLKKTGDKYIKINCDKLPSHKENLWQNDKVGCVTENNINQNLDDTQLEVRVLKSNLSMQNTNGFKVWLQSEPLTIQYLLETPTIKTVDLSTTHQFPLLDKSFVQVTGSIPPVIISITVPTDELSFILNPNQEGEQQFIAPEFEVTNESNAPLILTLKTFEQTTSILNDVLPTKYDSWDGLNKAQSKDIALGLVPKSSGDWLTYVEQTHWVIDSTNKELGSIKPKGTVGFNFIAHHGKAFSETLNPSYRLTFVFDLLK